MYYWYKQEKTSERIIRESTISQKIIEKVLEEIKQLSDEEATQALFRIEKEIWIIKSYYVKVELTASEAKKKSWEANRDILRY